MIDQSAKWRLQTWQGSKLGWSCGPSLPKLLSDHQIVLGGGPVVYWKTHHKITVFFLKLIGTDHFYACISFSVSVIYGKDCSNALYKKRSIMSELCVWFDKQILKVSYIRATRNLAGPQDFEDWWSDGPLPRKVNLKPCLGWSLVNGYTSGLVTGLAL